MATGALGPRAGGATLVFHTGWLPCCNGNAAGVGTVASSSYQKRFWRCIITVRSEETTPIAIWRRSIVTVTTRYTGAAEIVRRGMVLMTKADPLEEPCAMKVARTVLQTSGGSDPFAEFKPRVTSRRVVAQDQLWHRQCWRQSVCREHFDGGHDVSPTRAQRVGLSDRVLSGAIRWHSPTLFAAANSSLVHCFSSCPSHERIRNEETSKILLIVDNKVLISTLRQWVMNLSAHNE